MAFAPLPGHPRKVLVSPWLCNIQRFSGQIAWMRTRGAVSSTAAINRVAAAATAPPCGSFMTRPRRSFLASASVYCMTEARQRTCCRRFTLRFGGRPRVRRDARRARSPGWWPSHGTAHRPLAVQRGPPRAARRSRPPTRSPTPAGARSSGSRAAQSRRGSMILPRTSSSSASRRRSARPSSTGSPMTSLPSAANVPLGTMKSWIRRGLLKLQSVSGAMSDDDTIGREDAPRCSTAAEYVLGVLAPRTARRRAPHGGEPTFAAEVALLGDAPWRLAGRGSGGRAAGRSWAAHRGCARRPRAPPPSRAGFWNSLVFWRSLRHCAPAALAAASMAALIYVAHFPRVRRPLLATLDAASGQPGLLAAVSPAGGTVTIVPAALLTADAAIHGALADPARRASRIRSG